MPMQVELVSPERILFSGEATMVQARTIGGGDIAFLSGHAPFIGALAVDQVVIRLVDGGDETVAVHGGFVSVIGDNVKILSDLAEVKSGIDIARAQRSKDKPEEAIRRGDDAEAEASLQRAHARLKAAGQRA